MMTVTIIPNVSNSLVGKLADAELHCDDGPLALILGDYAHASHCCCCS
jgi:hypothetical protein